MIAKSSNRLLENVDYRFEETDLGVWRKFAYPTGELFEEFKSHSEIAGFPVLHYTRGRCPETGKLVVAKGVIAIGRIAIGLLAIGQLSIGILAIGQLGLGVLLGLGQATTGIVAVGQLAVGGLIGIGQFSTGFVAIGQFAYGIYAMGQMAIGVNVWDAQGATPAAEQFFRMFIPK